MGADPGSGAGLHSGGVAVVGGECDWCLVTVTRSSHSHCCAGVGRAALPRQPARGESGAAPRVLPRPRPQEAHHRVRVSAARARGRGEVSLHVLCCRVKYVKSWRGENLGLAKFEGVYLPLLWEASFCYRSPMALGYTRGHFCALVPPEPVTACGGAGGGAELPSCDSHNSNKSAFLPLMTKDRCGETRG